MPRFVYALKDAPDDPAVIGGKAVGLSRLARAGLPVPPGFVLAAEAFREFLRPIDGPQGSASDGALLAQLRAAPWPDPLGSELDTAYAELCSRAGDAPVAVRSSATAEDSAGASFAGQHLTLLNLRGVDAVRDAVLACWASLYGDAALAYRRSRAVDDDGPAMAVVVQALVPSDASGVTFTIDPVTGDPDVVLIDAAWGLGEGVVGGVVTPDHFAVRKHDGAVLRRELSAKRVRIVSAPGGGTREERLADERATAPALTDAQAIELARLAARIEEAFGGPQDIEWALADGRFAILQSRPVTAVSDGAAPEWVSEFDSPTSPDTIWTAANVQEVLPDQLSPLNISMTSEVVDRWGAGPAEELGVKLKTPDPFSGYFYGRAFLNVSMLMEMADQTPFGSVEAIMEQYFGQGREQFEAPPKQRSLARLWRYVLVTPRMIWFSLRLPSKIRKAERIVAQYEREVAAQPIASRTDEDLLATSERDLESGTEVAVIHVSGGGMTSSTFEWLRRLTERWLGDTNGSVQARLVTGLAGVESAQPAHELWDISRSVLASEPLREAFAPHDGAEIEQRLVALDGEDVAALRRQLDGFLARHGHRSVMEAEAAARSWSEDLPTVYAMIRNYLHADPAADPRRVEERQRHEREEATRAALARLRWWQRLLFRGALRQAQNWVIAREHTKSLFVRSVDHGRQVSRELARRLVTRGALDDVFDLYYLTWPEVTGLTRGELSREDAYAAIARRRAEEERNRHVILPETFRGRPKPLRLSDLPLPEDRVLRGIAVSPGRVTGRARVIMDPRQDAAIEPGEVLVAPVTDAGWTPLFIAAAGVVVDVGGSLSHGSTVAREYGLPAVVNVKVGTRLIQTGQMITVDGSEGIVVLEEAS
jgi:pyruvate,water dikinase